MSESITFNTTEAAQAAQADAEKAKAAQAEADAEKAKAAQAEADKAGSSNEDGEAKKPASKTIDDSKESAEDAVIEDALVSAGLTWDAVTEEFNKDGDLGEETRAKLLKAGYPKAMVDTYLEGVRASISAYDNAVYSAAGSEEQYAAMTAWAKANLSEPDKKAFNAAVTSGDVSIAKLAVEGLLARFTANSNKTPNLKDGKPTGQGGIKPFASQAEVVRAMRDPKYKTDPAYRDEVKERLSISTVV